VVGQAILIAVLNVGRCAVRVGRNYI